MLHPAALHRGPRVCVGGGVQGSLLSDETPAGHCVRAWMCASVCMCASVRVFVCVYVFACVYLCNVCMCVMCVCVVSNIDLQN